MPQGDDRRGILSGALIGLAMLGTALIPSLEFRLWLLMGSVLLIAAETMQTK